MILDKTAASYRVHSCISQYLGKECNKKSQRNDAYPTIYIDIKRKKLRQAKYLDESHANIATQRESKVKKTHKGNKSSSSIDSAPELKKAKINLIENKFIATKKEVIIDNIETTEEIINRLMENKLLLIENELKEKILLEQKRVNEGLSEVEKKLFKVNSKVEKLFRSKVNTKDIGEHFKEVSKYLYLKLKAEIASKVNEVQKTFENKIEAIHNKTLIDTNEQCKDNCKAIKKDFEEKLEQFSIDFLRNIRCNAISISDELTQYSPNNKVNTDSSMYLQEIKERSIKQKMMKRDLDLLAKYDEMKAQLDQLQVQIVVQKKNYAATLNAQKEIRCQSKKANEALKRQLLQISTQIKETSEEIIKHIKNYCKNTAFNSFLSETNSKLTINEIKVLPDSPVQSRSLKSKYKSCNDINEIECVLPSTLNLQANHNNESPIFKEESSKSDRLFQFVKEQIITKEISQRQEETVLESSYSAQESINDKPL